MALITRSLPGLFGGVSQQIPAMRNPTQCTEQRNGVSTVVDGLFKRPGSEHVKVLAMTGPNSASVATSAGNVFPHPISKGPAGEYQLLISNGSLMLYELTTGAVQSVSFPYGSAYLNAADPKASFRCVTVADYTFIVNTTKTVAMTAAAAPSNSQAVGYAHLKAAVVKTRYTVIVDGVPCSFTTGDTANLDGVGSGLVSAILAQFPSYSAYVIGGSNVIRVQKPSGSITVSVSDNWNGAAIKALKDGVDVFSDLPATFESGQIIKVNGAAGGDQNPYWVQYVNGRWTECAAPGVKTTLDYTTMPHQLRADGSGGWVFEPVLTWGQRQAGDDETNPEPSFVGRKIRGVVFFRNRLGFLSGDSLALSRAGSYYKFFGASSNQVLDTDPIDLAATSEQVDTLDWAVPFNENLLVWASNKQQFVLVGGDVLSPNSARLQPSTTFEMDPGVRPSPLGNKAIFVSEVGGFSQVNLYRVSDDTVTNMAEDLTEHAPRYIPGNPAAIVTSTVAKMLAVVPRAGASVKLLKYELDAQDRLSQKAWQSLDFDTVDAVNVLQARWVSRTLYVVLHRTTAGDPTAGGRYVIEKVNFEEASQDLDAGFGIRLDSRVRPTVFAAGAGTSTLEVPFMTADPLVFLKCVPGQEPTLLTPTSTVPSSGTLTTRYTFAEDLTGATVWAGRKYLFRYIFSEVFLRDAEGVPVMAASLKLVRFLVRYVNTGWFKATVTPLMRSTYEYPMSGRTVGLPGQGVQLLALASGEFAIPVQTRAAAAVVAIESDSYLPVKLPYAEWVGDVQVKAKR